MVGAAPRDNPWSMGGRRPTEPAVLGTRRLRVGPTFRWPPLPGGRTIAPTWFTVTYYDTRDLRLARAGITLYRRVEGRRGCWRLTVPHGDTSLGPNGVRDTTSPPAQLRALLEVRLRNGRLIPRATVRTRRIGLGLRDRRGALAEVALDTERVFVADRPLRQFRELVMRSRRPDTAALARLKSSLRDTGASTLEESPELFRVLALAPPTAPELPPADPPGRDHLASAIDAHFEAILTDDPGARLGADPEAVHLMRVATRRLRTYLRVARSTLDRQRVESAEPVVGKPVTRFLRVAKKFQDALGDHQDAVVAEGHLRGLVARAPSPREAFAMGRLAGRQGARRQVAAQAFVMAWPKVRRCGEKAFE